MDKNSKNSILIDTNIKDAQLLKKKIAEVCPEINVSLLNDSEFGNSPKSLDKFWRAIYYEINK